MTTTSTRPDDAAAPEPSGLSAHGPVLGTMRVALHLLFAGLLLVGLIRCLATGSPDPAAAVCASAASALAAVLYLAGTVWESRFTRGRTARSPYRWAAPWLAAMVLVWACLLLISPAFVWLAFPLMFLALHVLPRGAGLAAVAGLWAATVLVPEWEHARGLGPALSAGAVLGPGLGAVLAVLISSGYRALYREALHHRRTAEALRAAQAELAERQRAAGRLEERERLSREIHDTVAQGLSSILLVSRAAGQSLRAGRTGTAAEQVATIESVAAENLAEARRFVRELAESSGAPDLEPALRALCASVQSRAAAAGTPLRVDLRAEGLAETHLPEPVATAVLRAAQASLANVLAHAGATRAVVTATASPAEVLLDVADDGHGFDPGAAAPAGGDSGYGLPGLRRRAEALGGTLAVESAPDAGCVVALRLPLTSQRTADHPEETR